MFELFSKNRTAKIVLSPNAEDCIKLAVADLRNNLLALSGKADGFNIVNKSQNKAITVITDRTAAPDHIEGYAIEVTDSGIRITGSDALGTVYGIYTFAAKCLGIDPLYHFTDIFPEVRESMSLGATHISSKENQRRGASYLQEILDLRQEFNRGKWQGWYSCDKRLDIPKRIAEISSLQYTENKEN